jgi:hypothetical protein
VSNLIAVANERFTDTYTTDLGHELASFQPQTEETARLNAYQPELSNKDTPEMERSSRFPC